MHEHLTSAILKPFLANLRNSYRPVPGSPTVIVTTPIGQLHELGSLMAALMAAAEGWQVIYLGPNLPAEEIAAAVIQKQARVILLSLVYPADDPLLTTELEKLYRLLPSDTSIIIGGRISQHYEKVLNKINAVRVEELFQLPYILEKTERSLH